MPISLTKRSDQGIPLSESQIDQNWIALEDEIDLLGTDIVTLANTLLVNPTLTGNATATTPAALDDSTKLATTEFVQASVVQSGPLAGFRNAVINGGFDVWQRGGAPTTGTGYRADRWEVRGGSAQTTVSRLQYPIGDTGQYFLRFAQVVGAGAGVVTLSQKIEGVRTFAGQQVTLSYRAKCDIADPWNSGIRLWQEFGTGGSPSSTAVVAQSGPTLTSFWQTFTHTFTLPSISGQILGTDVNDRLRVGFRFNREIAFTFDIDEVQLELGPVATPFERRPIGVEEALCLRYYYTPPDDLKRMFRATQMGALGRSLIGPVHHFPVPMRAIPTVTYTDVVGNPNRWTISSISTNNDNVIPVSGGINVTHGSIRADAVFEFLGVDFSPAEARNLTADAEL